MNGVYEGLVLPMSSIAALVASLPRTISWASMTCHCRAMPFLDGNSVLIDTRLQLMLCEIFRLPAEGGACQIRNTDRAGQWHAVPSSTGGRQRRNPRCLRPYRSEALKPSRPP